MSNDDVKIDSGAIIFKSLNTFIDFGKAVNETIWEPKKNAMKEHLAAHPEQQAKLKDLWFEIWKRDWGAWGLSMTEHGRLFASEAEAILGKHEWLVAGNYFSGADLAETVADLMEEKEWRQP